MPLWYPAQTNQLELLDQPDQSPEALAANLEELRRVNRWLGGEWLTLRALERLTVGRPADAALSLLDVATGGADLPRAVVAWAQRRGGSARVLATDLSPTILRLAAADAPPSIRFVAADARQLPFADASFDVVTCSLALHHFTRPDAANVLREMKRVARLGVVVNDLVRGWPGVLGAWFLGRTLMTSALFRHDAPLSVRRAYTLAELKALAVEADLGPLRIDGIPGYRVALTAETSP